MNIILLLCMMNCMYLAAGQRRQFLQEVIDKIKSSPKHESVSPSFNGERQFEVIGTGRLPLENHSYQGAAAALIPETRNIKQVSKTQPNTSFLGRIFNRLKRKPAFFSSISSGNKKKSPSKRPSNPSTSSKFSPPAYSSDGFVPYFPGRTYFSEKDRVRLPDSPIKKDGYTRPYPARNNHALTEQERTGFRIENKNDFSKPTHALNIPRKPNYDEYDFAAAKAHVFAFDDDDMKSNDHDEFPYSGQNENDLEKERNPFQSENLALDFVVTTPKGDTLFKKGEDNFSAFKSENKFEDTSSLGENNEANYEDFDTTNPKDRGNIFTTDYEYYDNNQNSNANTFNTDATEEKVNGYIFKEDYDIDRVANKNLFTQDLQINEKLTENFFGQDYDTERNFDNQEDFFDVDWESQKNTEETLNLEDFEENKEQVAVSCKYIL